MNHNVNKHEQSYNVLVIGKNTVLVKKMSVSLQIALAAETHVADGMASKSQSTLDCSGRYLNTTDWLRF
jgi:hypothetical protein